MGRLGMTVPLDDVPLHQHAAWYRLLADLGYSDVWSAEGGGADGLTPIALAAAAEPRLRLGTAILPVFTRGPALLAQTAAAMADAAPGRFVLGLGASSNVIVKGWNGVPFEYPYQRVRDTVRFVRAALRGEKVGRYETLDVSSFRLARVPATPPPILVAALREQMLRLAGREADGVILNWVSPEDVAKVVPYVLDQNADADVVARIMVCPSTDVAAVRAAIRPLITGYLTVPVYQQYQTWLGRAAALDAVWAAWRAGDRRRATELVPDDLVDAFCVHGTPAQCRDRLKQYTRAGVTTPVIALVPLGADLRDALTALAPVDHILSNAP